MADLIKTVIDSVMSGVVSEVKRKTRRRRRTTRKTSTLKQIEDLLLGKQTRKASRSRPAKKQTSRKATVRTRSKVKRRG